MFGKTMNNKGFTLSEVAITIVILGFLSLSLFNITITSIRTNKIQRDLSNEYVNSKVIHERIEDFIRKSSQDIDIKHNGSISTIIDNSDSNYKMEIELNNNVLKIDGKIYSEKVEEFKIDFPSYNLIQYELLNNIKGAKRITKNISLG